MAIAVERSGKTADSKRSSDLESPDQVCREIARTKRKLSTRILQPDEVDGMPLLLIETDREGLILLGRLFIAQAHVSDDGFQIAPKSAGKGLFTRSSTVGLYIHRSGPAGS